MILNVRKSDGLIVDIDQKYDDRDYFNIEVPDGTLPNSAAAASKSYVWDGSRVVKVRETLVELKTRLAEELKGVIDIDGLKPILTELIKRI